MIAGHRLRVFKRLETDSELRARLAKSPRSHAFAWQIASYTAASLDMLAESLDLPRRIVEVES